jgi:predicted permease
VPWLESAVSDLRYAIRMLRKSPGVTAVAVLSLALGIGANTAIFTLMESTLLRPIALRHPERLRLLTWKGQRGGWVPANLGSLSPTFGTVYEQRQTPDGGLMHTDFTPRLYEAFRRGSSVFESLFAFKELGRATAVVDGNAEPVNCFLVSGDFYRGMEVSPVIGRAIGPEDDTRTQEVPVAVISYQYWTRRFARSPAVIGKKITLNEVPVTIIGVNPEYFTGIEPGANFEIWAPLNLPPAVYGYFQHGADLKASLLDEDDAWLIPMMGRLRPGVSDAQAESALDTLFQAQVDANPGPLARFLKEPAKRPRFLLEPASRGLDYLTERYDPLLAAVLSLAGLVLLIACANVANLLLAKSAVRQREISLRLALGAGRWRIARQLLAEGLLLASMAGVAGLIFGYGTRNAIPALLRTPWRPSPFDTAFDLKVLLVAIGTTFLAGMLFSLAPMWQSRRVEMNEALKDASRGTPSLSKLRIGRVLVVLEVALSVFLLAGAGLCVKTFANLRNTPLGFRPEGVLLFTLDLPRLHYPAERMGAVLTQFEQRLSAIAGVESATFSASRGGTWVGPGDQKPAQTFGSYAAALDIGSRFFETMSIRILYGRGIGQHDSANGLRAVVVNQEFARHFFPGEEPVGNMFRDFDDMRHQIVGVCTDWRAGDLRDPVRPAFYSAFLQEPRSGSVNFAIRIAGNQADITREIREAVRSLDPNLAIADVHTQLQQIESTLSQERLMASLGAVFGALALVLVAIGIYGVMAYGVARRTSEIGVRMALGARPGGVAWMILRETLMLATAGAVIGVVAVLDLSPALNHALAPAWRDSFAYGTRPNDPLVITFGVLVLAAVTVMAGYLPARRAARVDPMTSLRHE